MRYAFSDEQEELRRALRRLLDRESDSKAVRAAMGTPSGWDAGLWRRMSAELGLSALLIPEEHGGVGLGAVELVAVMEELGRALACAPFFSTACLATPAILAAGSEAQKQAWLLAIAEGTVTATLALDEDGARCALRDPSLTRAVATKVDGGYRLHGAKSHVIDGATADVILVVARAPGSTGRDGLGLYSVSREALTARALPTMDQTRRLAAIELRDVFVIESDRLPGGDARALDRVLDCAAIALAAEQLGGAQRCLDMAVAYAKLRTQFARPIGSFQAIKHRAAGMLVKVVGARSAVYQAGWVAAQPDSSDDALAEAAALAKAAASEAFFHCAAENIQIHGGTGFTWEHDAHLYFKRARASESLCGDPSFHRARYADLIGL